MSFPSCFRPSKTSEHHPPPPLSGNPNLTTYIYQTEAGTVSLTWSRSLLHRTLQIHLHNNSFHLHIKPFVFWRNKKHGSKKLSHNTFLYWNLSKARFESGWSGSPEPEPHSKYYLVLVVDHVLVLVVGDIKNADARARFKAREAKMDQVLVLKREHVDVDVDVNGTSSYSYSTNTMLNGKIREIKIDCRDSIDCYNSNKGDTGLLFCVDGERVLEVKRLKWKFRGNERVEVDGVFVQISWDVHDWVFENGDGKAVFMFKFEEKGVRGGEERGVVSNNNMWNLLGEIGKTGKSFSFSSMSMSSSAGSFGGSSSVMEWSSLEENELVGPMGFSLLVYAWKR